MSNVTDLNAHRKKLEELEEDEVLHILKNPVVHGCGYNLGIPNLVFVIDDNGAKVTLYKKDSADDEFEKWKHLKTFDCDEILYAAIMTASVLEQKIFMLRVKYEKETIDMDKPPSYGLPTGVDKNGNPTGFMEFFNNKNN